MYALSIVAQLFCLNREIPICVVCFKECNEYVLGSEMASTLKSPRACKTSSGCGVACCI